MTLEEYMRELVLMSRQYGQEEELYPLINMLLRENDNVRHLSVRDVHKGQRSGSPKKGMLYGYVSFPDLVILDERYFFSEEANITIEENKMFNMMYGCVEAKTADNYLDPIINKLINQSVNEQKWVWNESSYYKKEKDEKEMVIPAGQLLGELLWYGKVIYTRGWIWYYIELKSPSREIIRDKIRETNITLINKDNKILDVLNPEFSKELNNDKSEELKELLKEIEVLCINIGDFKSIQNDKFKKMTQEQRISLSAIGQYIEDEDRKKWNRLKYNLASIDWCGTNDADKFLL